MKGVIIAISAYLLNASLSPLLKKANKDVAPFTTMAISMFIVFLLSLILSLWLENGWRFKLTDHRQSVFILILEGVITVAALWLIILGFKYLPIWQQSMFSLLTPVFAGIFAYFLLGEPISIKLFVGLAIMGIGLFIAVK